MTAQNDLAKAWQRRVILRRADGHLKYKAKEGSLAPQLREHILLHKKEVLTLLDSPHETQTLPYHGDLLNSVPTAEGRKAPIDPQNTQNSPDAPTSSPHAPIHPQNTQKSADLGADQGIGQNDPQNTQNSSPLILTLYRYCATGQVVEVVVPWVGESLVLVPGPPFVEPLLKAGIRRGRIWLVAEVLDLLLGGIGWPDAIRYAQAKLSLDAKIFHLRDGFPLLAEGETLQGKPTLTTPEAA